ncbi:hypothetical protein [Mesoflavibacter sp. CH_XMU1422-2]|uniref:hypothetical protein n=1 Tax=Mesoflavibacter sp. CH_XMU1422-2 TaxID=3107770 RepID=UPI00300AC863
MKKLTLLLFLLTVSVKAQITYERGYFIDENDNKTECLIRNLDWSNSPDKFIYKLNESSNSQQKSISSVKEFRVYDTDQYYIKHLLTQDLKDLENKIIKRIDNYIFLKVLLIGKASLYKYQNEEDYFFYSIEGQAPEYLSHTKYLKEKNKVVETHDYKKKLYEVLLCDNFTMKTFTKLNYRNDALVNLFEKYNKCIDQEFNQIYKKRTKTIYRLKALGGLSTYSKISNNYTYKYEYGLAPSTGLDDYSVTKTSERNVNFEGGSSIAFGVEAEIVLPIQRNKWSVFIAPNYQNISNTKFEEYFTQEDGLIDFSYRSNLSYSFIELPIGLRNYILLNDKLNLFLQVAYVRNFVLSSEYNQELILESTFLQDYNYSILSKENETKKNSSFFIGIGCEYNKKMSLAINYYLSKKHKVNDEFQSDIKGGVSLIATYNIL